MLVAEKEQTTDDLWVELKVHELVDLRAAKLAVLLVLSMTHGKVAQ